jgi:hypothetical protein
MVIPMKGLSRLEAIMWSIALPGFSQLLLRKYWKGTLFVILEFTINVKSNFNKAIMLSFCGNIQEAIEIMDFQWILFYPCLYLFAMWDAYKEVMESEDKYAFLPFVFCAYFVTVGVFYSTQLKIFGILLGPVFLPMVFLIPGLICGHAVKYFLIFFEKKRQI